MLPRGDTRGQGVKCKGTRGDRVRGIRRARRVGGAKGHAKWDEEDRQTGTIRVPVCNDKRVRHERVLVK